MIRAALDRVPKWATYEMRAHELRGWAAGLSRNGVRLLARNIRQACRAGNWWYGTVGENGVVIFEPRNVFRLTPGDRSHAR
jgi:hypothetical protein